VAEIALAILPGCGIIKIGHAFVAKVCMNTMSMTRCGTVLSTVHKKDRPLTHCDAIADWHIWYGVGPLFCAKPPVCENRLVRLNGEVGHRCPAQIAGDRMAQDDIS